MKFPAISLLVLPVLLSSPINAQGFGPQELITETVNTVGAQGVYAADLDGDGDLDVLSASQLDKKLAFYLNEGGGQFGAQQLVTEDDDYQFNGVVAADLDVDGDVDVLACAYHGGGGKIVWYSNNGDGSFDWDGDVIQDAGSPRSVTLADLNADGYPDVLAVLYNSLCWYENRLGTSSADFGVKQDIRVGLSAPSLLRAADLDGDGDLDVLSVSQIDREISWYENLGGGASWTHWEIEGDLDAPTCIYAEDMDGDGDTDVIYALTTNVGTPLLAWYENVGTGSAGGLFDADSPHTISTTDVNGACNVLGEDLDGDGDVDVILAQHGGNNERISWYANDGLGGFGARQEITTSVIYVHSMYTADLDGDGDVDLLSASLHDDKVAWYENCASGHVTNYCTAGPNSVSPEGARIHLDGTPSISGNQMSIWAENLRPNQFGIFFCGLLIQDPPVSFGEGYRCVHLWGLSRLNPPEHTGTGTVQRTLDMTVSPLDIISAGDIGYFQFWYRDPPGGPFGFNLSDGLEITFCP